MNTFKETKFDTQLGERKILEIKETYTEMEGIERAFSSRTIAFRECLEFSESAEEESGANFLSIVGFIDKYEAGRLYPAVFLKKEEAKMLSNWLLQSLEGRKKDERV